MSSSPKQFPLRTFLRNHSDIYRWAQLPRSLRPLFDGTDMVVDGAEYFMADPSHSKNQFIVTHTMASRLFDAKADIIAIQYNGLVILMRYAASRKGLPETEAIVDLAIERVRFRINRETTKYTHGPDHELSRNHPTHP